MEKFTWFVDIKAWLLTYSSSLLWSLLVFAFYLLLTRLALPKIEQGVEQSNLKSGSTRKAYDSVRIVLGTLTISLLLIVWGVDFNGLLLISTSLITLTGVALFAGWSLLSNITAYFILLFQPPFRRGNFVRILDGDNYVEGYISQVNMFHTKLITEEREVIVYPNNLILARPSMINPREKRNPIGKISNDTCTEKEIDIG